MEDAVNRFRARMAALNRSFLQARISEQRLEPTFSESDQSTQMRNMSHYWYNWKEDHNGWDRLLPWSQVLRDQEPDVIKEQRRVEAAVKTLDDVAALPHYHMDGTEPPLSEEKRRMFLAGLEEAVNKHANWEQLNDVSDADDDDSDQNEGGDEMWDKVTLPDELSEFLALTNGVYDMDLRHSGMCDFSPTQNVDFSQTTASTHEGTTSDESVSLAYSLNIITNPETWVEMGPHFLPEEVDIAAGIFIDDNRQWPDLYHEQHSGHAWFVMYALCRLATCLCGRCWDHGREDGAPEPWAWRVLVYHSQGDPQSTEYEFWRFDSIVQFLEWYASWDERLDDDDMRMATSGDLRHLGS